MRLLAKVVFLIAGLGAGTASVALTLAEGSVLYTEKGERVVLPDSTTRYYQELEPRTERKETHRKPPAQTAPACPRVPVAVPECKHVIIKGPGPYTPKAQQ